MIISASILAQSSVEKIFAFDHFLHYEKETKKGIEDKIIFVNSQNPKYQMVVMMVDGQYFGDLVSFDDGRSYFFKVQKRAKTASDFTYFGANELENIINKKYSRRVEEYHRFITIDERNLELKFYRDRKMKKEICTHHLHISKSDFSLFYAYKGAFLSFLEDESELSNQDDLMVTKSEVKSGTESFKISLKDFQKVNFEIKIPAN